MKLYPLSSIRIAIRNIFQVDTHIWVIDVHSLPLVIATT